YAVLGGRLRHLPGGVDEYLRIAAHAAAPTGAQDAGRATVASVTAVAPASVAAVPTLSGAERRTLEKELSALERRIAKVQGQVDALHVQLAEHDVADYTGIAALHEQVRGFEAELEAAEERWLELGELLG
ncbi:MAG: ABC transporter C-terminal domain-containing protein, partial [Microcella sp.]